MIPNPRANSSIYCVLEKCSTTGEEELFLPNANRCPECHTPSCLLRSFYISQPQDGITHVILRLSLCLPLKFLEIAAFNWYPRNFKLSLQAPSNIVHGFVKLILLGGGDVRQPFLESSVKAAIWQSNSVLVSESASIWLSWWCQNTSHVAQNFPILVRRNIQEKFPLCISYRIERDSKHAHGFVHGTIGGCPCGYAEEFITMHIIHFVLCVDGIHKLG